ncbi:MAG: YfhO family protein [Oscillospiraceae bacterium]|nr:YfhO family protein [Oscillospiraceae bacterium]
MTLRTMAGGVLRGLNAAGGFLSRPRKSRYLYLTAFFLPVLIMGVIWVICGVSPFGSKMILAHDQWHQYYPFYINLRTRLQDGRSLLHSWNTGMGTSYLPLFAYYLASPLNLPAVILPESLLMGWYTLAVLIRIGLAGLFCALFLKRAFGRDELAVAFFSTAYALCAFMMGYYWNAIWLDTVALLPLVTLGTFSLLRDRHCVLYVLSLALSVYCSYYIGLFICIWVVLIFIGWHVVNWDDMAGFWTRLGCILLFSLVAVGMTALLTVPAYLGLQNTSSAINKFPETNAMNIVKIPAITYQEAMDQINRGSISELFDFFGREVPSFSGDSTVTPTWMGFHELLLALRVEGLGAFFDGLRVPMEGLQSVLSGTGTLAEPTTMEGGPNIFCGFFTMILALVYLGCKRISRRERIFSALLLLFLANSFLFRTLDYLWHGTHFPNMLPYRFSFLWSFTVIIMAFRAYTELERLSRWRAVALILPVMMLLYCVISAGVTMRSLASTAVALLAVGGILLYCFRMQRKEFFVLGLCVVMLLESLGCAIYAVNKIGFTESTSYPTKKEDTEAAIEAMFRREDKTVDLWRAEVAMKQTLNDGTMLDYNGISVFSSTANAQVSEFLQSIGIAASVAGNRYVYQEADPFTNLLLGLKYLIDRNGRNVDPVYFQVAERKGEVVLLENKRYLNLGFMVDDKALEYDATKHTGLPYDQLNHLFREMTGEEENLYERVSLSDVVAVGTAELSAKTSTSFQVKGACDNDNYVEASFVMPEDGILCCYSKGSSTQELSYYLNDEKQYGWSDAYGYNRCMGVFSEGDKISLRYRAKSGKTGSVTIGAAIFRGDVFDRAYEKLAESSMIPTLISDTRIEGAVLVQESGLLYLSIPNDPGWSATVDGENARISAVGNAMIGLRLEPGLHKIVLEYEAPGFAVGLKISIVSLAIFLVFLIISLIARFARPPIVKLPVHLADPRLDNEMLQPDSPPAAEPIPPKPMPETPAPEPGFPWNELEEEVEPNEEQNATKGGTAVYRRPAVPEQENAASDVRQPLATTGRFDPYEFPAELEKPGSFESLAYLEQLDRLLEEIDQEQNEASSSDMKNNS